MADIVVEKAAQRLKVAVLISGRGSNLAALLSSCRKSDSHAVIELIVSNDPNAKGLEHARNAHVPIQIIDHRAFEQRKDFDTALDQCLRRNAIELVCLAGFMRLLGEEFTQNWENRLVNIHPSLLPSFKGLNTHRRVLDSGVRISGCTTHFVRDDMDSGPIILQAAVPVHPDDTQSTLAGRVLACEHEIYPLTVQLIAQKRVKLRNEHVFIDSLAPPGGVRLISPQVGLSLPHHQRRTRSSSRLLK